MQSVYETCLSPNAAHIECDCKTRISLELFFKNPHLKRKIREFKYFLSSDTMKQRRSREEKKHLLYFWLFEKYPKNFFRFAFLRHWELIIENLSHVSWDEVQWKFGAAIRRLKSIVINCQLHKRRRKSRRGRGRVRRKSLYKFEDLGLGTFGFKHLFYVTLYVLCSCPPPLQKRYRV